MSNETDRLDAAAQLVHQLDAVLCAEEAAAEEPDDASARLRAGWLRVVAADLTRRLLDMLEGSP